MEREAMEVDVVIVGAGPSGLAAAIRLMQLAGEQDRELAVCVLEKGSEVGAHILSGAVIEPRSLDELLPDWREQDPPLTTEASEDHFLHLTATGSRKMPTPPHMKNDGNYIGSLGNLCRWLAERAEAMGIEVYPGFAAAEVLYDEEGGVRGVATGAQGLTSEGEPGPNFEPGMELIAKQTIFAEGCRGSLTKGLFEAFSLRDGVQPQTYGIGIKELWEIEPGKFVKGKVMHTVGWPMDAKTYGGSWLYMFDDNKVSVGFVIGLDYENPWMSPFDEMQRFKTHPDIKPIFENGRRISYGARALSEGGYQSIPKLTFKGGCIVGDSAGFLNVPKIKGTHAAMKSGMLAADAVFETLASNEPSAEPASYTDKFKASWLHDELYRVRNIRPAFKWGLWPALAYSAMDTYLFGGRAPWTLDHHAPDHETLKKAGEAPQIDYPKPDGVLTFDKLSSVFISNTNHEEDQPCHLQLIDPELPQQVNLPDYAGPEARYCPAGVYEYVADNGSQRLQINAQNCVHCKTCDIKDPRQNINWVTPQGGGGPNYPGM